MNLSCLLGWHDDLRHYTPGHLRLRCAACGRLTEGLRGPTTHVEPPVVRARAKRRPTLAPALQLVKRRKVG
jgi:hypothetical protein